MVHLYNDMTVFMAVNVTPRSSRLKRALTLSALGLFLAVSWTPAYAGDSAFEKFVHGLFQSAAEKINGVSSTIETVDDGHGQTHKVQTITVVPGDVQHRLLDLNATFALGLADVGGFSKTHYTFQRILSDDRAEAAPLDQKYWLSKVPKNNADIVQLLNEGYTPGIEISSAALVGLGPSFSFMGVSLGGLGVGGELTGNVTFRFRRAEGSTVLLSTTLSGIRSANLGVQVGGEGGGVEVESEGELTFDVLPNYAGLEHERSSEYSKTQYVAVDLNDGAARGYVDGLLSSTSSSLMNVTKGLSTIPSAALQDTRVDLSAISGVQAVSGVRPVGSGEARLMTSALDGVGGWFLHGKLTQKLTQNWYQVSDTQNHSQAVTQASFLLDTEFSFWHFNSLTRRRYLRITNESDGQGNLGRIIEMAITSKYTGNRASDASIANLFEHFAQILPREKVAEAFGIDGELLKNVRRFTISTDTSIRGDVLIAIRNSRDHMSEEEITARVEQVAKSRNLNFFQQMLVKNMIKNLVTVMDARLEPRVRLNAFKILRFNPVFKQGALGFILSALPKEQWPEVLGIKMNIDIEKNDGSKVSRRVQLGSHLNLEIIERIAEIKDTAVGDGDQSPNTLLGGRMCEMIFAK